MAGKDNHGGRSELPNGTITDHFATEVRRLVLGIAKDSNGIAVVIFAITLLVMVVVGVNTDALFYALAFGILGVVFYSIFSGRAIERQRLELTRIQNDILGEHPAQSRLPLGNPSNMVGALHTPAQLPDHDEDGKLLRNGEK